MHKFVSKSNKFITGVKAFAFGFGLNDDALTFNLFALVVVGDIGAGLALAVAAVVAEIVMPFTPFVPKTVGMDTCLALPLKGGIDWICIGIFLTAESDLDAVGPAPGF